MCHDCAALLIYYSRDILPRLPLCTRRAAFISLTCLFQTRLSTHLCSSSAMASALISVPTTASRFALLQVDSDSDSDSDTGKGKSSRETGKSSRSGKSAGSKNNQTTDKKKDKKKRKKEQQQSETNEVTKGKVHPEAQEMCSGIQGFVICSGIRLLSVWMMLYFSYSCGKLEVVPC